MIVFGGRPQEGIDPLDGALYDPQNRRWRKIPEAPAGTGARVGAWADDRLVIVSGDSTVAFVPSSMRWERITDGAPGVTDLVYDGARLIAWGERMMSLDLATGEWSRLGDLPAEIDGAWERSLRVADGQVYAIGLTPHVCGEYRMWSLEGTDWRLVPDKSLATSQHAQCNLPHDSAGVGDGLLIWEDADRPSALYEPSSDSWVDLEPPPVDACEGGTNPIWIGDRLLVDSCGTAAIFDVNSRSWQQVALAGRLDADAAVWTGNELLVWSSGWPMTEIDAWRWTPPAVDG
jgi:hypothetical protein